MKAIMYHYVRPFDESLPYFKSLHIEDFRKQLDYFSEKFGFVSKEEFLNCLKTGEVPQGIILTFDDGLKCHYKYVFEELKNRGLWGVFYIPTQPYAYQKFIDVHRIHILLGKYSGQKVYNSLNSIISNEMMDKDKMNEFLSLTYTTQSNDEYTLLVKRVLNYFLNYKYREASINCLMEMMVPEHAAIFNDYYLNPQEIQEMHDAGMIIGSHSVTHPVMSRLSYTDQYKEIQNSFQYLKNVINNNVRTFCYPYGGYHSFNEDTERILDEYNCLFSFNVEERDINSTDLLERPLALPRYDCNQFKFGQVRESSFAIDKKVLSN